MNVNLFYHSKLSSFIILCLVSSIGVQCTRETNSKDSPIPSESQLNVSVDYAINIANAFQTDSKNKNARLAADSKDSLIVESTETLTENGSSILHILNYKNNRGWVMVGADRRLTPILAYSFTGKFDLKGAADGVSMWLDGVKTLTKNAQAKLSKPDPMIERRWKYFEMIGGITRPLSGGRMATGECTPYDQYMHQCPANTVVSSPGYPDEIYHFASNWIQTGPYTYSTPAYTSTGTGMSNNCDACSSSNSRTGCGALATAMVLRGNAFLKGSDKPTSLDFTNMSLNMTNSCSGLVSREIELSKLIGFAYIAGASTQGVPFDCDIATLPSNIPNVFSAAGYSNPGSLVNFYGNESQVKYDLMQGYPLVMSGMKCSTCLSSWHIWVCDGYYESTYYNLDCSGYSPVCQETGFIYYHMQWGNGSGYNGWYAPGYFTFNGDTYNTNLKANISARP